MSNMEVSFTDLILEILHTAAVILPLPFEDKYSWARRIRSADPDAYWPALRRMQKRGLINITKKNNQKFIQLTSKGQIQALLFKAKIFKPIIWDGKWRLFMFDIPEECKEKRNLLRFLLKKNNYTKLQASVYISPFPLNREAIDYLKESGLIQYIRILKVEEMDNDALLLKKYHLKKSKI